MARKFVRSAALVLSAGLLVGAGALMSGCMPTNAAGDMVTNVVPSGGLQVAVRTELAPGPDGTQALYAFTVSPAGGGGVITTDFASDPIWPNPDVNRVQLPGVPLPTTTPGLVSGQADRRLLVAVVPPQYDSNGDGVVDTPIEVGGTADNPAPGLDTVNADLGDVAGGATNVTNDTQNVIVTNASTNVPLLFGPAAGGWAPGIQLDANMTVEKGGLAQTLNSITLASDQVGAIPDVTITLPSDNTALGNLRVNVDPTSVPTNYLVTVTAVATVRQTDANGAALDTVDANGNTVAAEGTVTANNLTVDGTGATVFGAVGADIALATYTWTAGTQLAANTDLSLNLLTSDEVNDPNNANNDTLLITVAVQAP